MKGNIHKTKRLKINMCKIYYTDSTNDLLIPNIFSNFKLLTSFKGMLPTNTVRSFCSKKIYV